MSFDLLIKGLRRRDFLAAAAGVATWPQLARAQRRSPTIGYLYSGLLATIPAGIGAFRQGLAEQGYVEGRNVEIEFREAGNDITRVPALLDDLVRRRVDVLVVPGSMVAARAARAATQTIPIVFSVAGDPVQFGLVASLSHPGGNVTGITDFGNALSSKRLELIKLLVPSASLIAMLVTPISTQSGREVADAREAARALGLGVEVLSANTMEEIDAAFATLAQSRADAFSLVPSTLFLNNRGRIVALASRYHAPGVYPFVQFTEIGGLMSYGLNLIERNHQAGLYAGMILNGRSPADLPVHRLSTFELAINLKTAHSLGLTVPATFLALADRVIE
jgi:putative ABC transport system substrate-binding protein